MLNLYPRLAASSAAADDNSDDDDESHVCYGIVVACLSLLLFCVLLIVVSVARACAITGVVVVIFGGLISWFAPTGVTAARRNGSGGVAARQTATPAARLVRRCACGLADAAVGALPAFTYEGPGSKCGGADDTSGRPRGSCLLCAVCLEDVQTGEMVRQLPACSHLFHAECIDRWLCTRRTCPLCRCELPPRKAAGKAAATESPAEALLPV